MDFLVFVEWGTDAWSHRISFMGASSYSWEADPTFMSTCRSKLICSAAWTPKRQPWLTTSQLSSYLLECDCFLCKASFWLFKQLGTLDCLLPAIFISVFWSGIESWAFTGSFIMVSWTSLDKGLMHFRCFGGRKRDLPWRSLMFGSPM